MTNPNAHRQRACLDCDASYDGAPTKRQLRAGETATIAASAEENDQQSTDTTPTVAFRSDKAYLAEGEVAKRLNISLKWLQKMRRENVGIPYHKFGKSVRYAIVDLLEFEASTLRRSGSNPSSTQA
jgi:hypothetical protein